MKRSIFSRFTVDKIAYLKQEFGNHVLSSLRRNQLNNIDFSIISNNCWGGMFIGVMVWNIVPQLLGCIFMQMIIFVL